MDYRLLRAIIMDNRYCLFFMLILRFWYYCLKHPEYFINCFFDKQRKSLIRISREIFASWRYWGMFPFEYFGCKLYRIKPERTVQEIVDYIPQYYLDHILVPRENDRLYKLILENKIMLDKFLAGRSMPRPRKVFTVEGGKVLDNQGTIVSAENTATILSSCERALFIKPADGRGGNGIEVFEPAGENGFQDKSGRWLDLGFLEEIGKNNDYIIQEGIEQVDVLNKIFPYSINTIRIPSIVKAGRVIPIAAILRIGRGNNRVDNSAQGGISVEIDIDTWRLNSQGHSEHPVSSYDMHPDTKTPFGQQLPMKKQVMELLKSAASVIPKCHILGWDVALTPEGAMIIEINPGFGIEHVQITCQRGIRKDLDIYR